MDQTCLLVVIKRLLEEKDTITTRDIKDELCQERDISGKIRQLSKYGFIKARIGPKNTLIIEKVEV